MNVNYIVSFNSHPQVFFDIELETKDYDLHAMISQIELAAFLCLKANGFNVEDVWKISTAADWDKTWCKEHGPLPSNFKTNFNGKYVYWEETLTQSLNSEFANLESIDCTEYEGIIYGNDGYLLKYA